jgi:hypothetical protein
MEAFLLDEMSLAGLEKEFFFQLFSKISLVLRKEKICFDINWRLAFRSICINQFFPYSAVL